MNGVQAMSGITGTAARIDSHALFFDGRDAALVVVARSGTGISEENAGRLFNAFFDDEGGSGWDWDSRSAVRLSRTHGGRIWAESHEGKGAVMRLFCRSMRQSAMSTEPVNATSAMVYVVDDDASMREAVSMLLRSVGLRVELFASAQEFSLRS